MSKIEQEVTIPEQKSIKQTGVQCDQCKNVCAVIPPENISPDGWHFFSLVFKDRYNEIEWFDVCSPVCYANKIKDLIATNEKHGIDEIDEMSVKFATSIADLILKASS